MHRGTSVMVGCVPVRAAGKRRKLRFATLYKEGAFCARGMLMLKAAALAACSSCLQEQTKSLWRRLRVSGIGVLRRRARENVS